MLEIGDPSYRQDDKNTFKAYDRTGFVCLLLLAVLLNLFLANTFSNIP
jgi:hypothetical protein